MSIKPNASLFVIALLALSLSGCSTLDAINPFTPSKKVAQPSELQPLQTTSNAARTWQSSVGAADEFTFAPGVAGDSIYAAARDGSVSRLDKDGNVIWRVSLGHPLSGGAVL